MKEHTSPFDHCGAKSSLLRSSGSSKWYSKTVFERITIDFTPRCSKSKIHKNVIFLSLSLFLLTQTVITLGNLQSTLNGEKGIGVASLAVQYGLAMVCILFFSDILFKSFKTCKRMLIIMIALQLPYFASNFYPAWGTMIPASIISGTTVGLILMGFALYVNEMSMLYFAEEDTQSLEAITSKFFGIFTFASLNSSIWGNLISFLVLMPDTVPHFNHTNVSCGIDFDQSQLHHNDNLQPPSDQKRYTLVTICLLSAILSIVVLIAFVDELILKMDEAMIGWSRCRYVLMSLSASTRQALLPDQLLLVPLTLCFGVQTAFFNADFTKAYIACSWGVYHVGFVVMFYGACGAVMGWNVGSLVNCTSQIFVIVMAGCLNMVAIILLCVWDPSPDFVAGYFIVSGIWGVTDAVWWSQISAVHGLLFPKNRGAAFSIMYFCLYLGYTFNFATSGYLYVRFKVALMFVLLMMGIAGYLIGQFRIRLAAKRKLSASTNQLRI